MAGASFVALWLTAATVSAQATDVAPARDALPGAARVGFAGAAAPMRLTGQLRGGYGFVEGAEGEGGAHHRLLGSASVAVRPHRRLAVAAGAFGRWDRHPRDAEGVDTSAVGVPWIALRGSAEVNDVLAVGADARLDVHGGGAPAFDPLGSRLTLRLLATARPTPGLTVGAVGGVRFDGTGRTVDEATMPRRTGDRVSLDVNAGDAAVLGLAVAWTPGPVELFGELTWEPWFGPDAPPLERSAGRFATGARLPLPLGFAAELSAELGFRSREPVQLGQLIEVEPRLTVLAALSYRVALLEPAEEASRPPPIAPAPPDPPEREPPAEPEPRALPVGVLRGLVRDFAGRPVLGASVRVDEVEAATRVDVDGAFELELEPGAHEVEVAAEGYATQRRRVSVEQNGVTILNVDLRRAR
jgi:hypothetical protein